MSASSDRQLLRLLRLGRRRALLEQRTQPEKGQLCYACTRPWEHLYPVRLPAYLFGFVGYEEQTDVRICSSCLRELCELLASWLLRTSSRRA